ncbi:MAG: CarD family transcriptional regulator [Acutalibacteraceae bacterium]|nr:CarD family transcriptional regulator [Acutalibacteraceae bacterium]
MYKIGDVVIYKNDGVCKIVDITLKSFKDRNIEYYVLQPVHNINAEIFVPKNNVELVGKIRNILTKEEILQMIKAMPDEKEICINDETERKERFKEILVTGDRTELVRLVKTLYAHKQNQEQRGRKLHIAEERMLKEAEKNLYNEFAYVLGIATEEVPDFIAENINR